MKANPGPFPVDDLEPNPRGEIDWEDLSRFLPTPQQLTRFVGDDKQVISVALDAKQSKLPKAKVREILAELSLRGAEQMMELASFFTVERMADLLGLPTWDSVLEGNDFFADEVGGAIREADENGGENDDDEELSEEDLDTEERDDEIEREIHDGYHRMWCQGVEAAFDAATERVNSDFVIVVHENQVWQISSEDWKKTAADMITLANGIDSRFEGMSVAQVVDAEAGHAGPHATRTFCLDSLGLLKRVPEVYGGGRTLMQAYSNAWR